MDFKMVGRSLKGKVAIVTGAGCAGEGVGNGRAEAILLADDGCSVLVVDLNPAWAQRTADIIKANGNGVAATFVGDVSSEEGCKKIVQEAIKQFGRLDILINNVGIGVKDANSVDIDISEYERGMRVNVTSMIMMLKYSIPEMLKNEGPIRGTVVNISSIAGLGGGMNQILYPTSKGAIINLTKNMAFQHGKQGIRINCVCPGSVWTPLLSEHPDITDNVRQARASNNMLGIEGYGWDTGYAVRWLAGPESRWVTGAILPVDAGLSSTVNLALPM